MKGILRTFHIKKNCYTHGKDHWISSWRTRPSRNKPAHRLRWRHRSTRSPLLTDKSTPPPRTCPRTAPRPPEFTRAPAQIKEWAHWKMHARSLRKPEARGATHLDVALFKERASDHTTRLLHRHQLGNVVTAGRRYLHTRVHLNNENILCKSRSL